MRTAKSSALIPVVLLGTMAYAVAEDLTLSTTYPSPRGVYRELRVGSSDPLPQTKATLHIRNLDAADGLAFRVDDEDDGGVTLERDATPFVITNSGQVGIGTTAPHPSAILEIQSTTRGFLPPRMTAYPALPVAGLLIFKTDHYEYYDGTAWRNL
ncbi:MAG: hypothetical protein HYY15_02470 [Candidatus Omnitrophica bacterium]|nr:hypothetical protein [Candidatus Omnitrophota bacterium]